jgi:hypothetical protein
MNNDTVMFTEIGSVWYCSLENVIYVSGTEIVLHLIWCAISLLPDGRTHTSVKLNEL